MLAWISELVKPDRVAASLEMQLGAFWAVVDLL